ncbi:MAG TPA: hypothetical protein VEI02_11260 [Planctomycetota bacterium]|nr:hypothetical protein [Planctomycetota bacterium]
MRSKLEAFVVAKLHCDHKDLAKREAAVSLQSRLGLSPILPQYVVLDPRDLAVLKKWGYGDRKGVDLEYWLSVLEDALVAWRAAAGAAAR